MNTHPTDRHHRAHRVDDLDGMLVAGLYGGLTGLILGLWWMAMQLPQH